MDTLINNKIFLSILLIAALWAPVFLARKLSELVSNANRSIKDYIIPLFVIIGLIILYVYVLKYSTRIMLGIPSLVLFVAFLTVTSINKYRK